MASSLPSPLKFLPIPSPRCGALHSHFLLNFQLQSVSVNRCRAVRLKISCSTQTIEIGSEENSLTKKKRKPRPSFIDQIHEKWSRRTTSSREIFPWEEQEEVEEIGENCKQSAAVLVSETDSTKKSSTVRESHSFSSVKKVNLPPWAHGNKQGVSESDSEAKDLDKSSDDGRETPNGNDAVVHLGKLGNEVDFEGEIVEESVKNDDDKIEVSQNGGFSNVKGLNEAGKKLPWQRENVGKSLDAKRLRSSNADVAEKVIPEPELKRIRNMAVRMVERIKVGAAGVTQNLVAAIHEKWKVDEVVKLKFEGPPAMNMKRTHEILEVSVCSD